MKDNRLFKFMACLCLGITVHSFDVHSHKGQKEDSEEITT